MDNKHIIKLVIGVKCCGVICGLSYPNDGFTKTSGTKAMGIGASRPRTPDQAKSIKGKLIRWANETKSPAFHSFWVRTHPFQWFVGLGFLIAYGFFQSPATTPQDTVRAEITKLVNELDKDGNGDRPVIHDTNRDKVLALMVAYVMNMPVGETKPAKLHTGFIIAVATYIVFALVYSFPPTGMIGIGRGKRRIERRRRFYEHARWVFVTIVVAGLIPAILWDVLKVLFGSPPQ